jgi:hypothetical protein
MVLQKKQTLTAEDAKVAPRAQSDIKFAFPAKAGIHRADDGVVEEWIPAFAGNAI